jgi:4-hydroxybenzoyl-CoA reductase subunit beta
MRLPPFEYLEPSSLREAFALLSQYKEDAKVIAGGTDLLPRMKKKVQRPKAVISLKAIGDFNYIREEDGLKIGALTPLQQIVDSSLIREKVSFLAEAAHTVGTVQLRHMGTIGGNICQESRCWYYEQAYLFGQEVWDRCFKRGGELCHVVKKGKRCYAVYSSDITPVLMALGGKVRLEGLGGERLVPLDKFFTGSGDRVHELQPEEILTEVQIPYPDPLSFGVYLKERDRGSIDYPIVGVAALLTMDSKGGAKDFKIVLTSVGSSPVEAVKAEDMLKGKGLSEEHFEEVADIASQESHPVSNHNYSAWYLRELVRVLVKRACTKAWELAREGGIH